MRSPFNIRYVVRSLHNHQWEIPDTDGIVEEYTATLDVITETGRNSKITVTVDENSWEKMKVGQEYVMCPRA